MKNAVIIHGWGANSISNWFPWLADELKNNGFKVTVPDFPNTQVPQLSEWLEHLEKILNKVELRHRMPPLQSAKVAARSYRAKLDLSNAILIGHSLGVPFILRFLEKLPKDKKIKAAFLVSGFERSLNIAEIENFVEKPFNWKKIKSSCGKFIVINSDNDPYIPLSIGKDLAKSLGVELTIEPGADHINAPGGFLSYPHLLQIILNTK